MSWSKNADWLDQLHYAQGTGAQTGRVIKTEGFLLSVTVLEYVPFSSHQLLLQQESRGILSSVFLSKFPIS